MMVQLVHEKRVAGTGNRQNPDAEVALDGPLTALRWLRPEVK